MVNGPSVNVALQDLNATTYAKHKLFITTDPAFGIGGNSPFLLEAKIRSASFGINENLGIAQLEFPSRPFGSEVGTYVLPIALFVDNYDNFVFRGFMTDQVGVLDKDNDQVNAVCVDYKWLISKISKIKGKIYTVDNDIIPQFSPGNTKVFDDESLYEKFRMVIPGLNKQVSDISDVFDEKFGTGYLAGAKTIFNENGDPDCAGEFLSNPVFMFDADLKFNNENVKRNRRTNRYFWHYASMLEFVCKNYITNVFSGLGGTTSILLDRTSISKIIRFGQKVGMDLIRPIHFDITNLSPMEAIDKIVKNIPGSWYWRLRYYTKSVVIEICNATDLDFALPGKSLFVGDGGKINNKTNNNVNVSAIKINKSARAAVSHAVAVGTNIQLETTLQYLAGWPQYLRPISDLSGHTSISDFDADVSEAWDGSSFSTSSFYVSDFKGINDYNKWRQYILSDNRTNGGSLLSSISTEDEQRYGRIYRYYVFPENQTQLTRFADVEVSSLLPGYEKYARFVDQLFFRYVLIPRKVRNPVTKYRDIFKYAPYTDNYNFNNVKKPFNRKHSDDPPFVFLYDSLQSDAISNESLDQDLLDSKKWIIPQESKANHYSLEQDNKVIIFQQPQFRRRTVSAAKVEDVVIPTFAEIYSRACFVTCRIDCDVPLIKDMIKNRGYYSNARLVGQEINQNLNAVIRLNAIYPNPLNFAGDDIDVNESDESEINGILQNSGQTQNFRGSKLVDWNKVERGANAPDGVIMVDDTNNLNQIIKFLLDDRPIYDINGEAELGRIDTSYIVGDIIDHIIGSELSDGTGGYYNMRAIIDKLEYTAINDIADSFTSKMSFRNDLPSITFLTNGQTEGIAKDGK